MLWSLALLGGCVETNADDTDLDEALFPQRLGPEGGTFDFGDAQIVVPEGAAITPVDLRFYETADDPPDGYEPLSRVWRAEPEPYVFAAPITVRIPYEPADAELPMLFWSNGLGGYDRVQPAYTSDDGGLIWADLDRLGTGFVATLPLETVEVPVVFPPADVLFVVDNSSSMVEEQMAFLQSSSVLLQALQATGLDFHLGVVSTDLENAASAGRLVRTQEYRFIDSATEFPEQVFVQMVLQLGTSGWYDEKGRAAAWTLLELQSDFPRNSGFQREEATLSIVFVSDEDDQSDGNPISAPEFIDWLQTKKPWPGDVVAHGLVDPPGQPCPDGDGPALEYTQVIEATGGVVANVCDPDWSSALEQMVDPLLDSARVALPTPGSSIERVVLVNGATETELSPAEYTWDDTLDTVFLNRGVRPALTDTVRIDYVPE
ncbi:MAG: hypothetical protein R3F61_08260 [Myxococcota bacterium]